MKRFFPLVCLLCFLTTHSAFGLPVTATDARGIVVKLAQPPQRIISLSPGTTEMLFALGVGKRIVGDTVYCDYPAEAKKITKIGDATTNIEKVVSLKPDLVIADSIANRAALPKLISLGIPLFVTRPTTLPAVEATLLQLGQITDTNKQASTLLAQMHVKRRATQAIVAKDLTHLPKVLVVVGVNPLWTAGHDTFIDDLITRAGGTNVAASVNTYAPYSKEAVLAHQPDIIVASAPALAAFRADPVFKTLTAVRLGHIYSFADENIAMRPGPRLADGLTQLAKWLHPGVK